MKNTEEHSSLEVLQAPQGMMGLLLNFQRTVGFLRVETVETTGGKDFSVSTSTNRGRPAKWSEAPTSLMLDTDSVVGPQRPKAWQLKVMSSTM